MTTAYPIPDAALDADIAILGRKGGGKTFTAKGIVERLLDMGRRVLVLDPLGVWAGLRTAADGEAPGYPVAIFGGQHGDLPLDTAAAVPMADVLARENVPAVIDLSELTKNAQQSFLLAFLHELRRVNQDALTLVLEEADVFAPQNPQGDDSKQLHHEIDWIARRGRFRGFRLITICQRPARLSKDVLTQAATMIAHRLPAPQDRDAVKAWVEGNGDRDEARKVFDTLARLDVGEAWVWASEIGTLERARFPAIKTLDTSATPKAGEKRIEPKTLADVDLSAIRGALAAATHESSHIPREKKETAASDPAALAAAEKRGYEAGFSAGHQDALSSLRSATAALTEALGRLEADASTMPASTLPVVRPAPQPNPKIVPKRQPAEPTSGVVTPVQQRVLDAIAWWRKIGVEPVARARACVVAGYSPKASTFGVYIAELARNGLVETAGGGVKLTGRGLDIARTPAATSRDDLRQMARGLLSPKEAEIFDVIYRAWPQGLSRHAVSEAVGLSPTASTTGVYLSKIAGFGIITTGRGEVRAADWLFPGRAA